MEVKNYWNRTRLGTALVAMRLTALISYKLGYSDKEIIGDRKISLRAINI